MGVGKRRLVLLSLVVVLVVVMVSLPTADAALDEYKADAWTDSAIEWTDDANAYDGDWGTYAYDNGVAGGDDYPSNYAYDFDSAAAGSGTITQVDIVVRLSVSGLTGASDWWQLTLDVGASTDNALSASPLYNQALTNLTYTDVTEPNGGGWTWAEIRTAQVHFDTEKVGGADGGSVNIYEYAFKVTTTPSGNDYTAYPNGDFSLAGDTSLIAGFVKTLIDGFTLAGETSLIAGFVKTLIEGFTLTGTTSIFVIIQKIIAEGLGLTGVTSLAVSYSVLLAAGFALAGAVSLVVNFSVRLSVGFSLGGSVAMAVSYVKSLVEGFSLAGTVSAFKVLIVNLQESFLVGVGANITKIVGTAVAASMIYLLFFSLEMWGYLGPVAMVIGGYLVMTKDKNLGVIWFVVECLIMAQYFALLEATPEYWWHIFILLIGGLSTAAYSLGGRKR